MKLDPVKTWQFFVPELAHEPIELRMHSFPNLTDEVTCIRMTEAQLRELFNESGEALQRLDKLSGKS